MGVQLRSAAVLGAGQMGADIAAHLANAAISVRLYDRSSELAAAGLDRARRARPDRFFTPDLAALITPASFDVDDDLAALADADWIIEAVIESLDAKQALLSRVEPHRRADAIVSTNTSGLSVAAIGRGRSEAFRRAFLGTHFFNPPRYLHLVEIITTPGTDPAAAARVAEWLDVRLGKGVIRAKDTPGFIANRIGVFGAARALELVASGAHTIEQVDLVTGPLAGRPKSATFRTMDLAGLDILAHVAADLAARLPTAEERRRFVLPPFVASMIERGLLGEKTGAGFYRKAAAPPGGRSTIEVIDPITFTYRPAEPAARSALPGLDAIAAIEDAAEREARLLADPGAAGDIARATIGATRDYAASISSTIADDPDDVGRALAWGLGWSTALGAAGTRAAVGTVGATSAATSAGPIMREFDGAALRDLGDGVLFVELRSTLNVIDEGTLAAIHAGLDEAATNGVALVIGTRGANFSAGANLRRLVAAIDARAWDAIDAMVQTFQAATSAIASSIVPVVAAPVGLALGGGCEICLHCDRVHAAAETYIGLVETAVGLIPAGGGTTEVARRTDRPLDERFKTLALSRVSTSAPDARRLGYLRAQDEMTMNPDRLIADAKATALLRARTGFRPRVAQPIAVGGADDYARLSLGVHLLHRAGRIGDDDAFVAKKLAWVLTGGHQAHATSLTTAAMLELEREGFLELCGREATQRKILEKLKREK